MCAAIVNPLRTRCVHERALSLAFGDTNLFVDNWLQISLYPYKLSPNSDYAAIYAHYLDDVVNTPVT
jgi:hypothetical protein